MGILSILLIVGYVALGLFMLWFGVAMNSLERHVADMHNRLEQMSRS